MNYPLKHYFLTVNWRLSASSCPVDTERPPISPPLEWGYLAGSEESSRVCDAYQLNWELEDTIKDIDDFKPDIVYISTVPSYLYWRCPPLNVDLVRRYCCAVKNYSEGIRIVIVGPHAATEPDWVLENTMADYAFIGEPDGNFSLTWSFEDYEDCEWLHSRGDIGSKAAPQRLFKDGRHIDYQVFHDLLSYLPHAWGRSVQDNISELAGGGASIVEYARGCSYDCSFCLRSGFRKNLRFKPIAAFQKEIEQLSAIGISYVFFIDEDFGRPIARYVQAMEVLSHYGMKFGCQARPDAFGPQEIELLRSYGCLYLELGLESLDVETRSQLGKFNEKFGVSEIVEIASVKIPHVFSNIFDAHRLIGDGDRLTHTVDNEGYVPNPFICYPGTVSGDRIIQEFREKGVVGSSWEICEAIYTLDSVGAGIRKLVTLPEREKFEDEVSFVQALLRTGNQLEFSAKARTRFEEIIDPRR